MSNPNTTNTNAVADVGALTADLHAGRERFLALVAEIRPDLHRYCARMTGSISAGEDVVQETLARAYYALGEVYALPPLRSWLFQIAHQRSIDYLRRYDRRMGRPLEDVMDTATDQADSPEDTVAREEALRAALSAFLELAPAQRSCVILKDVLGHSVEEIAQLLELTVPAVKAALHRGRERLRKQNWLSHEEQASATRRPSAAVTRYAALFNARDWDGCARDARRRRAPRPGVAFETVREGAGQRVRRASTRRMKAGASLRHGSTGARSSPPFAIRTTSARDTSSS